MTVLGGLDIGGTKVHVRVVDDASGDVLLDERMGAPGWAARSDDSRAEELARIVAARVAPLSPAAVVAGVHGSDSDMQRLLFGDALRDVVPVGDVVNDAELVLPAAGIDSGTGVIAGTGSCATSRDGEGAPFTVGGWGWVLGDEGGATGIVRDAAKSVLALWDDRAFDALTDPFLRALGARHPHELGHLLSTLEPVAWARYAPVVFTAAERGSAAARRVIDAHVDALVALVRTVGRRGGDVSTVAAAGGVLTGQPGFFRALAERLGAEEGATARVVLLDSPPVAGAVRLARELIERKAAA